MRRVDEIMCDADRRARKPSLEDTLALLLGKSMPAVDEAIADRPNPESREDIESKFGELNRQTLELVYHQRNISKITDKFEGEIRRLRAYVYKFERAAILPAAVVYFVHLLEKANRFFEYKRSAMLTHNFEKEGFPSLDEIRQTLLLDKGLKTQFSFSEEADICDAAQSIFWELVCKHTNQPIPQDKPVLFNWIYRLVFRARQEDYVMDQDPEVELKKMMTNEPCVYDLYFLSKQLPSECKKISKLEAYEKYSELVSIINIRNKMASKEREFQTTMRSQSEKVGFS